VRRPRIKDSRLDLVGRRSRKLCSRAGIAPAGSAQARRETPCAVDDLERDSICRSTNERTSSHKLTPQPCHKTAIRCKQRGSRLRKMAATPATCGAEKLVPDATEYEMLPSVMHVRPVATCLRIQFHCLAPGPCRRTCRMEASALLCQAGQCFCFWQHQVHTVGRRQPDEAAAHPGCCRRRECRRRGS